MAELVDALDLGSSAERREGSIPFSRTKVLFSIDGAVRISRSRICFATIGCWLGQQVFILLTGVRFPVVAPYFRVRWPLTWSEKDDRWQA